MNSKRALYAYFAALALFGAVSGLLASLKLGHPRLLDFAALVVSAAIPYVWYYLDAEERSYRRTLALGGSVIMFTPLAIPYYLVRSRLQGERLKAIFKFFGLGFLSLFVPPLASLPFVFVHWA